jgi:hypothetical protein
MMSMTLTLRTASLEPRSQSIRAPSAAQLEDRLGAEPMVIDSKGERTCVEQIVAQEGRGRGITASGRRTICRKGGGF